MTALQGALHRLGLPYTVSWGNLFFKIDPRVVDARRAWMIKTERWELGEYQAGLAVFDADRPLLEVGGGHGVTACLWSERFKFESHIVLEPFPGSVRQVRRQRDLNGLRFHVIQGGVGYVDREVSLTGASRVKTGGTVFERLGGETVTLAPLRDWVWWPAGTFNLAVDAEGAEFDILEQDWDLIKYRVCGLVIDWTGRLLSGSEIVKWVEALRGIGFEWVYQRGNVSGFRRRAWVNPGGGH